MNKWLSLIALVTMAACGEGDKKGGTVGSTGPGAPPPPEVDVVTVAAANATTTQDLPGRLQATRTAQVRARVEGILEQRLFTEGTDIQAGTPLFRIDARTYKAQSDAAKADLAAAKASLDRYAPLLAIKAVSQQEYDTALARLKQAQAQLAKADLDLENALPSAPISGRIGRALVTEGALVGRGEATHLTTIEQLDPIRVEFSQSYSDLLRLQQAVKSGKQKNADSAQVELVLEDGGIHPVKGKLLFTDLAVDPGSGTVILRAEFPNPKRELLPGTFVRVRVPQAKLDNVWRVPQRSVIGGPQGQQVLTVDSDNKVVVRPIAVGVMAGADFIVTDGLKNGEQVIVNGVQKVRPGATVKPVPWNPTAPLLAQPSPNPSATEKK